MRSAVARFGAGWKRTLGYVGDYQARLLFTTLYFTVLAPVGLILSRFGDPLKVRRSHSDPSWSHRDPEVADLASARRQF
jgi:hypothetical protein